jgi:hypothetical protein
MSPADNRHALFHDRQREQRSLMMLCGFRGAAVLA